GHCRLSAGGRAALRRPTRGDRVFGGVPVGELIIRPATRDDAAAIDALLSLHQTGSDPFPRTTDDIRARADRFVVREVDGRVRACAELAPLTARVGEIRSMVVDRDTKQVGVSDRLMAELRTRARTAGYESLCAFTNDARAFIPYNFSIVPHVWLP